MLSRQSFSKYESEARTSWRLVRGIALKPGSKDGSGQKSLWGVAIFIFALRQAPGPSARIQILLNLTKVLYRIHRHSREPRLQISLRLHSQECPDLRSMSAYVSEAAFLLVRPSSLNSPSGLQGETGCQPPGGSGSIPGCGGYLRASIRPVLQVHFHFRREVL